MLKISIDCNVALPLPMVSVGRGSALRAELLGVPEECTSVQMHVSRPNSPNRFDPVAAKRRSGGGWVVYANGLYFPVEGNAAYHLTGLDANGESVWMGSGMLRILPSVLNVSDEDVSPIPAGVMVPGADGLYYPLTIKHDEDGVPYPVIGEGVTM